MSISRRLRRSRLLAMALAVLMPVTAMAAGPAAAEPPGSTPMATAQPADPGLKAAWEKAAKSGKPVEVPARFTETMKVWAEPDGKNLRAELHTRPVQLKNLASGTWEPIDTRIVARDGKLQAARVKTPLGFGERGAKSLVSATEAEGKIGLGVSRALPEPKISGNTITYPDAIAPGADLVVLALADGFVSQVVFRHKPDSPVTVRLPLTLPKGTTFGKNAEGLPQLKDAKGQPKAAPIVLTATDAKVEASPEEGKTSSVTAKVETSGKSSELVFSPDAKFLADPAVTYPVTIAAASEWFGGGRPDDAWVSKNNPGNNATAGYLRVGTTQTSADIARVYLKFNTEAPELVGAKVVDADLYVWNYKSGGPGGQLCGEIGSGIVASRITSSWTSTGLSWNNQPSNNGTEGGSGNKYGYSVDPGATGWCAKEEALVHRISGMARAWIEQGVPNHGLLLRAVTESPAINWRQYYASEYGGGSDYPGFRHPPALMVEYTPAPSEPMQALYVRPRSSATPTLDEISSRLGDSVDFEPADPEAVTPAQLESDAEQSTEVVGSLLKDAALPEGMAPEEVERWSNPDIWEDPTQPPAPKSAVAHWLFDETTGTTATDSMFNGNKAMLKSGTRWVPGKTGTALSNTPASAQPQSGATAAARHTAALQAVKQGTQVTVPEETSETSITYAMPDGRSFTTEVSAAPVRARHGDAWIPIDTTLAELGGVLKPKTIAAGTSVEISTGGSGPFVTMTHTGGRSYALSWPAVLPKPTVKGSTATYADAAGLGADLVVTALPTGFRHEVVLRERPAKPLELRIGVDDDGLTLTQSKAGRLQLKTGNGKNWGSLAQPTMWDGSAKGVQPLAKKANLSADVVTKGGRTELVLKPDHAFLADAGTVYPVRLASTAQLPITGDVGLWSLDTPDFPASPSSPVISAGTMTGNEKLRTYLRFDTAGLSGQTVTDAKLSVLNIDSSACGSAVGAGIQVRRVTGAWDANNLHWANKPTATTEDAQLNTAGYGGSCADGYKRLEWNVTGMTQDWTAGAANHGLVLQSPTENNTNNWRHLTSSENTEFTNPIPTLTVTTSGPTSKPTVSSLAITPAQDVAGTTVTSSLTPQLAATVADTIGGNLTSEFEIEHDPAAPTGQGTGQIWAGTSPPVASGNQAALSVAAGKLTDGWKVRWRARAVNAAAGTASAWSGWQLATVDVPDTPTGPSVSALRVTPSTTVDGKTTTSSLTPELQAHVDDPAGGTLRADFEVEHDPAAPQGQGTGPIWAGVADNVTAGTQASVTVPTGKLTDGWLVRWRARAASTTATSPWSDWQLLTVDPVNAGDEPLAATATPLVRTDESFAIAGWVRLDDRNGRYAIAEQKGVSTAPFHLGVDPTHGLVFTMKPSDSASSPDQGAISETPPPVGEWFHLAGSYDGDSKALSLYLNGNLIKTQAINFRPWHADGPFTIGTAIKGGIDDLWVFPRTLSASDVSKLHTRPGETTSPASVLDAARAADVSRKMREAKGASPVAANSLPWPTGKSHPLRYTTAQECDDDVAKVRPKFTSFRSRFSGCFSGQVVGVDAEKVNNALVIKGQLTGDITLLVDADQANRVIAIRAKFDNVVGTGSLLTTSVGLKLKTKGHPNSTHCQPTLTDPFGPNLREKSQAGWNSSPLENWGMSSSAVGAEGRDLKSTCRFSILVKMTPIGSKTRYVNLWTKSGVSDKEFQARCDSASYVYAPSGCVFTYRKPYMEMGRNDKNDKNETWEEQFDHIKKALTNPNSPPTYPALGGPSYPHSAGRSKDMPGGSASRPLHRVVSDPNYDLNAAQRGRSEAVCRREISSTWVSDVAFDPLAKNCDEYPFASTDEGSLGANPDFNFSVLLIRATHNQAHGRVLGAWYGNNRILRGDPFWIKLQ
ncbi:DNRLRE domain-containing protein [Nonomuraea sp. NPDC059023]|uniref:DNRLRE domain-containing protein n=1 Tax=unclassified Nonomuraea TaxID=2593643 RepID=UPI003687A3C3